MHENFAFRNFFNTPFSVLFEELPTACAHGAQAFTNAGYGRSDFEEDDEKFRVELEVPGINKEEIKIDLKENILTVTWSRKRESEKSTRGFYERPEGTFTRRFSVKGADPEKVRADLKNGVLTIELGKQEEVKEKSIEIN